MTRRHADGRARALFVPLGDISFGYGLRFKRDVNSTRRREWRIRRVINSVGEDFAGKIRNAPTPTVFSEQNFSSV